MLIPVDDIADVVEVARDFRQFRPSLGETQPQQHILRNVAHQTGMTLTMLGVAEKIHLLVSPRQVGLDFCITF